MNKEQLIKAKELLDEALKITPDQREKFLDNKCGSDIELKKEIFSLVHSLENKKDFLEEPLTIDENSVDSFTDPYIGKQIGNYLIDGEAGVGGMGIVYLGTRNDKEFEHKVAVKILRHGITSEYLLKRFQVERQTLANLQHEYIARLLDGGKTEDGLPYLVMEFIDGIPITEYCNQNNLNVDQRLELFHKVCSAVQYAHQNLVIHRDIKPGNILVTKPGTPKLLDFGIAKLIDEDLSDSTEGLTKTGVWHLTPEYSSPEQIRGEKITTVSDIYSLGVLLYEILTGEQPYRITSSSPLAISKIIAEENVLKPSEKVKQTTECGTSGENNIHPFPNPEKISHLLKGDLDNIVLKAMHKDQGQRYSSVQEFKDDINRYLKGLPVTARKDTITYRALKFVRRHKVGFAIFVIVNLIILASIAAIIYQRNIAAAERDNAKLEAQKVEQVNSFLQEMLSSVDPTEIGRDVKVYDILEKAAKDIETNLVDQPEIEATIRSTLGNTYVNLGEYDNGRPFLEKALLINENLYGTESKQTAFCLHDLGLYYDWIGEYNLADSLYEKSVNILRRVLKQPTKKFADVLNDYAIVIMNYGQYENAEKLYTEAIDIALLTYGEKNRNTAVMMNNIALNYMDSGNLDKAEKYFKKSMTVLVELLGKNRPEIGSCYNNLSYLYALKNEFELAEKYLQKSYQLKVTLKGEDHPDVGLALNNLGAINFKMKRYDKAEKYFVDAIKQYKKTLPEDHVWIGLSFYWLGKVFLEKGRLEESEVNLRKSLNIRIKKFPEGHKDIWQSKTELGVCLLEEKKYKTSEKFLTLSLEYYHKNYPEDTDQLTRLYENIVKLYESTVDTQKAAYYQSELEKLINETSTAK